MELLLDMFPEGASMADKRGCVRCFLLLVYNASPTARGRFLPLHWAAAHEKPHLEVLAILLATHPQGTRARDHNGLMPLDHLYKVRDLPACQSSPRPLTSLASRGLMCQHENHCRDAARMLVETGERVRRGEIGQEHPVPDGGDALLEEDELDDDRFSV